MELEAMSAAAAARWRPSTNWIVTEGSLDGAISFDTTSGDGAGAAPGGVLLLRPPGQASLPCEITVCFGRKHDIHRIYIRSTARSYEIFYATDWQNNSKNYLCTADCTTVSETSQIEIVATKSQDGSRTGETPDQMVWSDSNSSDENGWVEVKLHNSCTVENEEHILPVEVVGSTSQIHYEATAEGWVATPCLFLTFRLLSLQTKACVHIEEIYIYADPVESINPDTPASTRGNLEGTSLLSMLVPSLLQLSKSKTDSILDSVAPQEAGPATAGQESEQARESEIQLENQKVAESDQLTNSVADKDKISFRCVEKVLDELVSRVGKIEGFCSRFEENMMKPLQCIETRLQRLEHQLDLFVGRTPSSEHSPCSGISAPEILFGASDSKNEDDKTIFTRWHETGPASPTADISASVPESRKCLGLIQKALDFSLEDDDSTYLGYRRDPVMAGCSINNKSVSVDGDFSFEPESGTHTGLAVDTPQFSYEYTNFLGTSDFAAHCTSGGEVRAFHSALIALSKSAATKSPNSSILDMHGASHATDSDFAISHVSTVSEGAKYLSDESEMGNAGCEISDTAGQRDDFVEPLSFNKMATADNLFLNSYVEHKGCEASYAFREGTGNTNSSFVIHDVVTPLCASLASSDLLVKAPEFPIEHENLGSDEALDSHFRDSLEDQEASLTDGRSSSSSLAVFLSSKMSRSSNCSAADINKNELAFPFGFLYGGVGNIGRENYGNNINDKVDLDLLRTFGPPSGILEKDDCNKITKNCSSVESLVEGSTYYCGSLQDSLEQNDIRTIPREWPSYRDAFEKGLLSLNLHDACVGTKRSIGDNWHDESAEDSDIDSTLGVIMQSGWSDESSTDSHWGPFAVNQTGEQIIGHNKGPLTYAVNTMKGSCQPSSGYSHDKSDVEIKLALRSAWDDQDLNLGLEFESETEERRNGIRREILLGEISTEICNEKSDMEIGLALQSSWNDQDPIVGLKFGLGTYESNGIPHGILLGKIPAAAATDDDGLIGIGDQHSSFRSLAVDQEEMTVNPLLLGGDDLKVLGWPRYLGADVPQNNGTRDHLEFDSLI